MPDKMQYCFLYGELCLHHIWLLLSQRKIINMITIGYEFGIGGRELGKQQTAHIEPIMTKRNERGVYHSVNKLLADCKIDGFLLTLFTKSDIMQISDFVNRGIRS